MKISIVRRRILVFLGMVIASLFSIILRLIFLQFLNKNKYTKMSQSNRYRVQYIFPQRGNFLDKDGIFITKTTFVKMLILKPGKKHSVDHYVESLRKLSEIINIKIDFPKITAKMKKNRQDPRFFLTLKTYLTPREIEIISFNYDKIYPIKLIDNELRFYETRKSMFHFIGYIGMPDEKEINDANFEFKNAVNSSYKIGKIGLEKTFNSLLEGKFGMKVLEVDSTHNVVSSFVKQEPENGQDLKLTVSLKLQKFLESEMEDKIGSVIVNEIETGNIIGIISNPSIDPNKIGIVDYKEEKNAFNFVNRALNSSYTPGSTFKIVSALALLENNIVDLNTTVFCNGQFKMGSLVKNCWKKTGHGKVNVIKAVSESCNCFFYKMALNLPISKLTEMCEILNLDKEEEFVLKNKKSVIPSEKWKRSRYKDKWYTGDTLNSIIGQGFLNFTPIKLLSLINSIASGSLSKFKIINDGVDKKESSILSIKEQNLDIVRKGLEKSLEDGVINFTKYHGNDFGLVGKTGTSQRISKKTEERMSSKTISNLNLNHDAFFIGYAPFDNPKYAIVAAIENGKAGINAAALATKVMKYVIENNKT